MAWQKEPDPRMYAKFRGLLNTVSPERFAPGDLAAAINADIDETGNLTRCAGYTQKLAAAGAHSLYASGDMCLYVQGTSLKRLATNYTSSTLRTVTADRRMSYWTVNARTYFSNGIESGIVEQNGSVRSWGLETPPSAGVAVETPGGGLPAGKYQYALAYLRMDGQESGTSTIYTVEVHPDSGILFSNLPVSTDPTVAGKIVYVTKQNGETRYEALVLNNSDETAIYWGSGRELVRPSETEDLGPAPAGQCIAFHKGRALVAAGSVLYPSLPYAYELFDLRDYFDFADEIKLIAPVDDGVYLCTAGFHYWLPGMDPKEWSQVVKTDCGAIAGSLTYVDGKHIGEGVSGIVALWLSRDGICIGANGGNFKILSADRVNANISAESGASIVVDRRLIAAVD